MPQYQYFETPYYCLQLIFRVFPSWYIQKIFDPVLPVSTLYNNLLTNSELLTKEGQKSSFVSGINESTATKLMQYHAAYEENSP